MAEETNFDLLDFGEPAPVEPEREPDPREAQPEPVPVPPEPEPVHEDEPEEDHEAALLSRLEEETGRRLQLERDTPTEASQEAPQVTEPNFLADLDIDEVLSSSDNLNRLLLSVYNAGLGEAVRRASDNVLGSVNDLVSRYVREQLTMTEMVKEFYEQNEDLRPLRRTVAAFAKEISRDNPELQPHQVFAETATKVRTALKLKKIEAPRTAVKPGNFAPQRGRKAVEPEVVGIEKEIMELMEI
jgi:hypothetical protein